MSGQLCTHWQQEVEMKYAVCFMGIVLAGVGVCEEAGERVLFADTFQSPQLAPEWQVAKGYWRIEDGALTAADGGLIVLDKTPGSHFELEVDVNFGEKWASIIPFYGGVDDYGTLYLFRKGYWETFEMDAGQLGGLVQHRDAEITPGAYRRVRVVCEDNLASFHYDGKFKGTTLFRPRPGARLAFSVVKGGGALRLRNIRLRRTAPPEARVVYRLEAADLAGSVMYADRHLGGKPCAGERLNGDAKNGVVLEYGFRRDKVFESRFARIPLEVAARCGKMRIELESDGSGNKFFVIVHDRSGEQHLVADVVLMWQGWQEFGVDLDAFLERPANMQRLVTRWGGDGDQAIGFPITAVDIGVAKRGARGRDRGLVRFRNVRFVE